MEAWVQPAAWAIVALYVTLQGMREARPQRFLLEMLLTASAALAAEESCIRLYGFYDYSNGWWGKVGHVPLLVLCIWPVVIHSATSLGKQLLTSSRRPTPGIAITAIAAGFLVLTDAALIEPIAVHAGLWHWTEPGLFHVPPIGIIGWALFAALCATVFATTSRRPAVWSLLVLPATLIGTHLLLLAIWWGALRWVNHPVPSTLAAALAIGLSTVLCALILLTGIGRGVRRSDLLMRIPAATFFGALLVAHWPGYEALLFYFLAFTPPNIVLTLQANSSFAPHKEIEHV
jgi:hypothetical protein